MSRLNHKTQKNNHHTVDLHPTNSVKSQKFLTFYSLVFGILAYWLMGIADPYMQNPAQGLHIPPLSAIILRIISSHIIALLIFVTAYEKAKKLCDENWMIYFYAFGTGFAWPIAMDLLQGIAF